MILSSYRSPKTEFRNSSIEGYGRFAVEPIKKDEIVAIRSGHLVDYHTMKENAEVTNGAQHQIADDFFLVPLEKAEFPEVMCYFNHSCRPNLGMQGNIVIVAARDIEAGEELCIDYAMIFSYEMSFKCQCGDKNCRKVVTGKDWMKKELRDKYKGYFSSYLSLKF